MYVSLQVHPRVDIKSAGLATAWFLAERPFSASLITAVVHIKLDQIYFCKHGYPLIIESIVKDTTICVR